MLYTLYPCGKDGVSQTFVAAELSGDGSARKRAEMMMVDYSSCAYVAVWDGDRLVLTIHRHEPGAPPGWGGL